MFLCPGPRLPMSAPPPVSVRVPPQSMILAPLFVMQQLDPGGDGEQRRLWGAGAAPLRDAAVAPPLLDAAAGSRGDGEEQRQPLLLVMQQLEPGDGEEQRRSWGAEAAVGSAPPPRDAAAGG